MNAAGIAPAAKVLGKNGPHPLDLFEKTVRINLVGTFNVIRLAAFANVVNMILQLCQQRARFLRYLSIPGREVGL